MTYLTDLNKRYDWWMEDRKFNGWIGFDAEEAERQGFTEGVLFTIALLGTPELTEGQYEKLYDKLGKSGVLEDWT